MTLVGRYLLLWLLTVSMVCGCARPEPPSKEAILAAAGSGDVKKLERLLANGGSVDAADSRGYSALSVAAFNGDIRALRLLLRRGAKTETGSADSMPLLLASRAGHVEVVRELLAAGAKPEADPSQPSILGEAKTAEIARLLIEAGANVNAQVGQFRSTPLHQASDCGHAEVVAELLRHGAKPNIGNDRVQTPLHLAAFGKRAAAEADAEANMVATIRALLRGGADPNLADGRQNLPIHYAARNPLSTPAMILALVEGGSQVTHRNSGGRTPLEVALANGKPEDDPTVLLLKELEAKYRGKEPQRPVKSPKTPGPAAKMEFRPHTAVAQ